MREKNSSSKKIMFFEKDSKCQKKERKKENEQEKERKN